MRDSACGRVFQAVGNLETVEHAAPVAETIFVLARHLPAKLCPKNVHSSSRPVSSNILTFVDFSLYFLLPVKQYPSMPSINITSIIHNNKNTSL